MPAYDVVLTGAFSSGMAKYKVAYYYQDSNGNYDIESSSVERWGKTDVIT
jgi:hypothetical protein